MDPLMEAARTGATLPGNSRVPNAIDNEGFFVTWPRRHRRPYRRKRLMAEGPELKVGSGWNRDGDARAHVDYFRTPALLSPHLSPAGDEEPHLLNGPMGHRSRRLAWCQFKMRHASSLETQKETNV